MPKVSCVHHVPSFHGFTLSSEGQPTVPTQELLADQDTDSESEMEQATEEDYTPHVWSPIKTRSLSGSNTILLIMRMCSK